MRLHLASYPVHPAHHVIFIAQQLTFAIVSIGRIGKSRPGSPGSPIRPYRPFP